MKTPQTPDLPLEVLGMFRVVFKSASGHFEKIESAVGVSGAQLWALSEIAEAGVLTINQLSSRMALHQSTTSNMLDKLEGKGMIERQRSTEDRRVVTVKLTDIGQAALSKAPGPFRGILPEALMRMEPAELKQLKSSMEVLLRLLAFKSEKFTGEPLGTPISLKD